MQRPRARAVQAADMAAPVEGAVATLSHALCPGLKPTTAAQQLTTIQARGGAVARPCRRPHGAGLAIVGAKVWRLLKINQVHGGRRLVSRVFGLQVPGVGTVGGAVAPLVGVNHSGGPVEAVLQEVAYCAEAGQAHPTGAHGAGARHAVALALLVHLG